MTENYNAANMKDCPAVLKLGAEILGATEGPIKISRKVEYLEQTCNQAKGVPISKRIKSISYTIKATLMEISKAQMVLLGAAKKVTTADLGKDVFVATQALEAAEIGGGTDVHKWPEVIAELDYDYDIDGEKFHGIEVTFYTKPVPAGGTYYEVSTSSAGV